VERNQGGRESRTIETRRVTPEALGFPLAAQAARLVRQRQPKPQHKSTTDFQTAMGEENLLKAMRFVTTKRPKLQDTFMHTRCQVRGLRRMAQDGVDAARPGVQSAVVAEARHPYSARPPGNSRGLPRGKPHSPPVSHG